MWWVLEKDGLACSRHRCKNAPSDLQLAVDTNGSLSDVKPEALASVRIRRHVMGIREKKKNPQWRVLGFVARTHLQLPVDTNGSFIEVKTNVKL